MKTTSTNRRSRRRIAFTGMRSKHAFNMKCAKPTHIKIGIRISSNKIPPKNENTFAMKESLWFRLTGTKGLIPVAGSLQRLNFSICVCERGEGGRKYSFTGLRGQFFNDIQLNTSEFACIVERCLLSALDHWILRDVRDSSIRIPECTARLNTFES